MRVARWIVLSLLLLAGAQPVWSHAVLARSEPPPNARLAAAPAEIRLWFTEPVEPAFSAIELRDSQGRVVAAAPGQVDATDPHQLYMQPGALAEGLYTVVWRNVSAADGHHSEGSFPFTIGAAPGAPAPPPVAEQSVSLAQTLVRWLNLVSLALAVGSLGFVCFVWRPGVTVAVPDAERRLRRVIWFGWGLVGVSSLALLWLQTAVVANVGLLDALHAQTLYDVVRATRFGTLWRARVALWVLMAGLLLLARRRAAFSWAALGCGAAILLLTSLYGHAAAVEDRWPSVLSDWLHLLMTALWVGGLAQFLVVIPPVRRTLTPAAPMLGRLAGYFSLYARIAVIALIATGLYAMWLHVGSLEGLLTTRYGRLLVVKLLLIAPLLAVALVNLVWTQRRLLAGHAVWAGRLRNLVGVEFGLTLAVLAVVGAMTAIGPARGEVVRRAAATTAAAPMPAPEPQPISATQMVDDLHVHLTITPGWVGENSFAVTLTTMAGEPVADAALIRLRFEHQTERLGESELQITGGQDSVYRVSGANLSAPGDWRIRMTVQRPDQFDAVVDFLPAVPPPPPPEPVVAVETTLPYRTQALGASGLLLVGAGGYWLVRQRLRFWQGVGVLASALIAVGSILLAAAA
jgi:copper transport protein